MRLLLVSWGGALGCIGGDAPKTPLFTPSAPDSSSAPPSETALPPDDSGTPGPLLFEDGEIGDFLEGRSSGTEATALGVTLAVGALEGSFRSRVFDAGRVVRLERIEWLPDAPYGKPLPDGGAAESGYPGGGIDMRDDVLLAHFDELGPSLPDGALAADSSGAGNELRAFGEIATVGGPHGLALDDGIDTRLGLTITANHDLQLGTSDFTWSYWLASTQPCTLGNNRVHLGAEETDDDLTHLWLGCMEGNSMVCPSPDATGRSGGTLRPSAGYAVGFCGATPIDDGRWHHVALVKEGHDPATLSLYVDGQLDASVTAVMSAPIVFASEVEWAVGAFSTGTYPSAAAFDEVVVLRRAWSPEEAAEAHRRLRTRLTLAVRACSQPDCGDDPPFSPALPDPIGALEAPVSHELQAIEGRYLQYEAELGTSLSSTLPLLRRVSLHAAP